MADILVTVIMAGITVAAMGIITTAARGGGYHQHSYNQGYRPSGNYPNYQAHSYSYQARPCQQVSKYTRDEYGNAHKIAGTMCYNNYGEGYIVEGSRYEIR